MLWRTEVPSQDKVVTFAAAGGEVGKQIDLDGRVERALAALEGCKLDVIELRKGHRQLQVI